MTCVFERQAIEYLPIADERKLLEHLDRSRMPVEQLAEVRFSQPPVDVRADLDADDLRDHRRSAESRGEEDLTEAALAEQPFDSILKPRLRA